MSVDDGGAAFPGKVCTGHIEQADEETPIYEHPPGLTILDYFAAKAKLTGEDLSAHFDEMCASIGVEFEESPSYLDELFVRAKYEAWLRYEKAGAMIVEKRQRENNRCTDTVIPPPPG